MAWIYSAGILLVGVGLHTFLKRWTTLGVMVLFVMLNFTSSGGIFRPELQPGFFGALHAFWNGAGFVEGVRSHVYFGGHGLGGNVLVLAFWLLAGLVVMGVAGLVEAGRRRSAARNVAWTVPAVETLQGQQQRRPKRRPKWESKREPRRKPKRKPRRRSWKKRWECESTGEHLRPR